MIIESRVTDKGVFYTWEKGIITALTEHFGTNELECHCKHVECVEQVISQAFIQSLESLRQALDERITVNRGYSCQRHQDDLKAQGYETAQFSQHVLGNAADITSKTFSKLLNLAPQFFMSIGTGSNTIHVDGRRDRVHRWSYGHGM